MCVDYYKFALVWAFLRTFSILVAFKILPLIFSFPFMNSFCALVFPSNSAVKSSSESERLTVLQQYCQCSSRKLGGTLNIDQIVIIYCIILTIRLLTIGCNTPAHNTLLLEIKIPALLFSLRVSDIESYNGLGILEYALALGGVGPEGVADDIECTRGRESI